MYVLEKKKGIGINFSPFEQINFSNEKKNNW
jgi:hypothetical protein